MKKQILIALGISSLAFNMIAQKNGDPKLIPCNTYEAMEQAFEKDPNLRVKYNLIQSQLELEYQAEMTKNKSTASVTAPPIYTVPIVFHIMGRLNVTDQTFINLINYINNDYARTGPDVASISPTFSSLYVDAEMRFALAKKDPSGKCTNGIIRHDNDNTIWSQTAPAYNYSGTGTNRWPSNRYLNVYIVGCISSANSPCPSVGSFIGGYTYLPGGAPSTSADAIVMVSSQLAQSNATDSRTLSHEIGHWFNLQHTWGNTNNPGVGCGNDAVGDTPNTRGQFSTCPSSVGSNTCDPSTNDNIENIMNYSSCAKMFTQGQVTRMRSSIASATAGRNNLWSAANLSFTGISSGYTCVATADFNSNKTVNCTNATAIIYNSLSQLGSSGSVSWSFEGGTPATSTATAPTVSYVTPGTYSVSLTATNSSGSATANKINYVQIVNAWSPYTAPITEDFEAAALPFDLPVNNLNNGSVAWAQTATTGGNSTSKSIFLNNASVTGTGGHIDFFQTPIYNCINTTNLSLSFYYAYARKIASQADTFRLQVSTDCGGTWQNILGGPSAASMATASGGVTSTPFVPTAAQWKLHTVSTSALAATSPNPNGKQSVRFRFYFRSDAVAGSSNNIYIDQINLAGIVGLNEIENSIALNLYPNPTNSSSTLDFNIRNNEKIKIKVIDLVGRVFEETDKVTIDGYTAKYIINKNNELAKGVYIINLEINNTIITKKLIIN